MENHTAKHFVLQLGSLIGLYLSVSFLLVLIFGLINLVYPDAAEGAWGAESASSSVRIGIAMVFVFFPTYLILTRLVNKTRRSDSNSSYLGLTKWLIYLSLLIAGLALLGDLVAVIMAFLDGEITTRFILKALAVLFVIGGAFYYYLLDAKGYWLKNERKSITFGSGASIVVLVALVFGFINIETPVQVREQKLDDVQLTDLQNIQWQIQDYLAINNTLPRSLDDVLTIKLPIAPEGRDSYRYELTEKGFKLCATFAAASRTNDYYYPRIAAPTSESSMILNPDNWEHGAGEVCFERAVTIAEPKQ